MTIIVHQRPLEATRSANKSCEWVAEAIVNGRTYTAASRVAPASNLARQLVADVESVIAQRFRHLRANGIDPAGKDK